MVCLMILGHSVLLDVAQLVLQPFYNEEDFTLKLLVVMVVTPTLMNTLQFWVTDNIIKKKEPKDPNEYKAVEEKLDPSLGEAEQQDKEKPTLLTTAKPVPMPPK